MRKGQHKQARASCTTFALVGDGTLNALLFTQKGTMIRDLDGRWMRRAEAEEDLPNPDDLREFRVALPDELSLLVAEALAALDT